jgi:hypothetical protein
MMHLNVWIVSIDHVIVQAESKRLPPSIFDCKHAAALKSACDFKTQSQCVAEDCVWCRSAAVAPACYTPVRLRAVALLWTFMS